MHLIKVLKEHYEVEENWEGKQYLGITLDWDYKNHEVHLSMPEYVECTLAQFNNPAPSPNTSPINTPFPRTEPLYSMQNQKTHHEGFHPLRKNTSKK
jgi:hypothetical protein